MRCECYDGYRVRLGRTIRNENIHQVGIAPIEDKFRENCLRGFDHIGRRSKDAFVKMMEDRKSVV